MSEWKKLDQLLSKGSQLGKAGSLGGLHAHREKTLSQFFTPEWVVDFVWNTITPAFIDDLQYSLLDNSIGSARMFRHADPKRFSLSGFDIDGELVEKVTEILDNSGFELDICQGAMENIELGHYSASLINPAFSIPLSSPNLDFFEGVTHYGKHGPDTSAVSHEYGLAQALAHSDIVAAVVPRSVTEKFYTSDKTNLRLRAVYNLPLNTFIDDDVKAVRSDLLIFGPTLWGAKAKVPEKIRIKRGSINIASQAEPLFQLHCRSSDELSSKPIRTIGIDESIPVITLQATTNKSVIMSKEGREIALTFFDGATEGKVRNAIYRERLFSRRGHRYPTNTKYRGQFALNLDVLVLQDDPFEGLKEVMKTISNAGGVPELSTGLVEGLKEMIEEHKMMTIPYGRSVYRKGTPSFKATAKKMSLLNRHQKGAVVGMGDEVQATRIDVGFSVETKRGEFECDHDLFFTLFDVEEKAIDAGYWEELFPPIRNTFPKEIAQLEEKAKSLGLDSWLTWDFQLEDLYELAFRPHGGVCGWQMALGKTRLGLALAMLLEGESIIVVKSRLVDEMEREITELNVDNSLFNIIRTPKDAINLKKINIISYNCLKQEIKGDKEGVTLAHVLKGRISNVIADEGGLISNANSLQTRALWNLEAKRGYIFDGTPMANYVREMLNLASWTNKEERSYQPYSINGGFIYKELFEDAHKQPTGRQAFFDDYVQIEWATNEFLDTGVGAKREVPKIRQQNLGKFREWISPVIKRRVQQEPAVTKHVKFPVPVLNNPISIDWDFNHLCLYIKAVEEFANWYKEYVKAQNMNEKGLNLTLILARLEACFKACNVPSKVSGFAQPLHGLTSKERACLALIKQEVEKGRRPIVFARNPTVLNRLSKELDKMAITNLVFTGEENIVKRTAKLNSEIRNGDTEVMLASLGVTQDGLNLAELNTFIFYNRSYKAREEFQGIYRLIRPQQESDVYGYFLHLAGSIDEYQGQLIEWKALASEAGLDYGDQPKDEDFSHFDAFIYRFLEGLPELKAQLADAKKLKAA